MSATLSPKRCADLREHPLAAPVLGRVVEQRGDRLVLAAAVLDHQRADAEEVADIGDAAALAHLGAMGRGGELERLLEALA